MEETSIQFPVPIWQDTPFKAYFPQEYLREVLANIRYFSPTWKKCAVLTHTLRVRGRLVTTLNLADVHGVLASNDNALLYPSKDIDNSVWDAYRLLRVDYTTRQDGLTPLIMACWLGHENHVRRFIKSGANVSRKLQNGNSILMETIASPLNEQRCACVKILLENGARLDAENTDGHTAVTAAVTCGDLEILKLLLAYRPSLDLNRKTKGGSTVLTLAVVRNHFDLVHFLVAECGVDIKVEDDRNLTAICWAQALKHREIAGYLSLQLAAQGQLEEFIKRRERLLREYPEDIELFGLFFEEAMLLVMLQPARKLFLRDSTVEALVSHGAWDALLAEGEEEQREVIEAELAFLKMGLWFVVISCGMLYSEKDPLDRFLNSSLKQVFLENINALLSCDENDEEDRLLAQAMLLPVVATKSGRDWLFEVIQNFDNILDLLTEEVEEDSEIQRTSEVCRCFSDLMESNYITYDLRRMSLNVGQADLKQVCPDPPLCVRDKITEVMVYMDDLRSCLRERQAAERELELQEMAEREREQRQNKHRRKRKGRRLMKQKQEEMKKEQNKKPLAKRVPVYNPAYLQKAYRPKREPATKLVFALAPNPTTSQTQLDREEGHHQNRKGRKKTTKIPLVRVQSGSCVKVNNNLRVPLDVFTCCEPLDPSIDNNNEPADKKAKNITDRSCAVPGAWTKIRDTTKAHNLAPISHQNSEHFPSLKKGLITKKVLREVKNQPEMVMPDDLSLASSLSQSSIDSLFYMADAEQEPSEPGLFDAVESDNSEISSNDVMQKFNPEATDNILHPGQTFQESSASETSITSSNSVHGDTESRNIFNKDNEKEIQNKTINSSTDAGVGFHMPSLHDPTSFAQFTNGLDMNLLPNAIRLEHLEAQIRGEFSNLSQGQSADKVDDPHYSRNRENNTEIGGKIVNISPYNGNAQLGMAGKSATNIENDCHSTRVKQNLEPQCHRNIAIDTKEKNSLEKGMGFPLQNETCPKGLLDTLPSVNNPLLQSFWLEMLSKGVQPTVPPGDPGTIPWIPQSRRWMPHLQRLQLTPAPKRRQVEALHFSQLQEDLILNKSNGALTLVGLCSDGAEVAIHCRPRCQLTQTNNEVTLLKDPNLHNPYIIKYKCCFVDVERVYMATELMEGNIDAYLQYLGAVGPQEPQRNTPRMLWQLLSAVSTLHKAGRVHTDLKPSHILVDLRGDIRLAGLKRCQLDCTSQTFTQMGKRITEQFTALTSDWLASALLGWLGSRQPCSQKPRQYIHVSEWLPKEVLSAARTASTPFTYCKPYDMQAVGMLAYYMWSGGKHIYGDQRAACLVNIQRDAPNMSHVTDDAFLNLLCLMLHPEPTKRLSADEALVHPFFWTAKTKYCFIQDVYKELKKDVKLGKRTLQKINSAWKWIGVEDWAQCVGAPLYSTMESRCGAYYSTVTDLLRFMNDVAQDYTAIPEMIMADVKDPASFFLAKFPRVFMALYEIVRAEEQWRMSPALRNYWNPAPPYIRC